MLGRRAIDVAGAEDAKAPAPAHDDREVLVRENSRLAAIHTNVSTSAAFRTIGRGTLGPTNDGS